MLNNFRILKFIRYGLAICLIFSISTNVFSQQKQRFKKGNPNCDPCKLKDRLVFGLNGAGGGFSNSSFSINISPNIGYRINDKLIVGLGGTYAITKYEAIDYTYKIYGGNAFLHYEVIQRIFANLRYEQLIWDSNRANSNTWNSSLYIGAGYGQRLGKGIMQIAFGYDLLYDKKTSPYDNAFRFPIVTVLF